jgi:hypothetical protein
MFSKIQYWKNRKTGKRGQGEKIQPVFIEKNKDTYPLRGSHLIRLGRGTSLVNRREAHQNAPNDPDKTKKKTKKKTKHA